MNKKTKCYCGHTDYCDCGPLEELKQETLEEAAERYVEEYKWEEERDPWFDFMEGAKWQMDKQDNFAVGFAEWSVARALGCDSFTINQDELNIYKKYIDTLNGN